MAVYCFLDASRAEQQFLITALGAQDNELMTVYVGMKDWEKLTVCSIFLFYSGDRSVGRRWRDVS